MLSKYYYDACMSVNMQLMNGWHPVKPRDAETKKLPTHCFCVWTLPPCPHQPTHASRFLSPSLWLPPRPPPHVRTYFSVFYCTWRLGGQRSKEGERRQTLLDKVTSESEGFVSLDGRVERGRKTGDDMNPTFEPKRQQDVVCVCGTVYFLLRLHWRVQDVLFSPHEQYIFNLLYPAMTKKTPTAMKTWQSGFLLQLLDLWAISQTTSHKFSLSVKQSIFTRDKYILFF